MSLPSVAPLVVNTQLLDVPQDTGGSVVVVVVVLVVVVVVLLVVVIGGPQSLVSNTQATGVHSRPSPDSPSVAHVCPPRSPKSQSSPGSITPLPQSETQVSA